MRRGRRRGQRSGRAPRRGLGLSRVGETPRKESARTGAAAGSLAFRLLNWRTRARLPRSMVSGFGGRRGRSSEGFLGSARARVGVCALPVFCTFLRAPHYRFTMLRALPASASASTALQRGLAARVLARASSSAPNTYSGSQDGAWVCPPLPPCVLPPATTTHTPFSLHPLHSSWACSAAGQRAKDCLQPEGVLPLH